MKKSDFRNPYLVKPRTCLEDFSSRINSRGWEEIGGMLRKCKLKHDLIIHSVLRNDFRAVKAHPFFRSINWEDLVNKRITPPFKPQSVELTPTDHKSHLTEEDDKHYFKNFSWGGGESILSPVCECFYCLLLPVDV